MLKIPRTRDKGQCLLKSYGVSIKPSTMLMLAYCKLGMSNKKGLGNIEQNRRNVDAD